MKDEYKLSAMPAKRNRFADPEVMRVLDIYRRLLAARGHPTKMLALTNRIVRWLDSQATPAQQKAYYRGVIQIRRSWNPVAEVVRQSD